MKVEVDNEILTETSISEVIRKDCLAFSFNFVLRYRDCRTLFNL